MRSVSLGWYSHSVQEHLPTRTPKTKKARIQFENYGGDSTINNPNTKYPTIAANDPGHAAAIIPYDTDKTLLRVQENECELLPAQWDERRLCCGGRAESERLHSPDACSEQLLAELDTSLREWPAAICTLNLSSFSMCSVLLGR